MNMKVNKHKSRILAAVIVGFIVVAGISPAGAASLRIIRDAEIEETLSLYSAPIFDAAGLAPGQVKITIVNSPELNAFVTGGTNIFINTGLLMQAKNAETIIGVLAHETGHVAGGHLIRGAREMENAFGEQLLAMGLGAAAAVGGSPQIAAAVMSAGSQIAERNFLSFTRDQEQVADHLGLEYLETSSMPASGLLELLETFRRNETNNFGTQTPYVRTHPLSKDRIAGIRNFIMNEKYVPNVPDNLKLRHNRMVAKLTGFLSNPDDVIRKNSGKDTIYSRYALAVAYYRKSQKQKALAEIDKLLKDAPDDAYFHELKGQVLYENGDIEASVKSYKKASDLKLNSPLIMMGLAQSLSATGKKENLRQALELSKQVSVIEPKQQMVWKTISEIQEKLGNRFEAELATAELFLLRGDTDGVQRILKKIEPELKQGSPNWLKVRDIEQEAKKIKDDKEEQEKKL